MNDWRTALREGDPGAHAALTGDEVERVRRAVLSAVPMSRQAAPWAQPLLVAVTIALMIGSGAMMGRRAADADADAVRPAPVADDEPVARQLQFSTPGGTRIIWTFNPDLHLTESTP